ncbi:MAG: hypothetical protein H7Y22_11190 [Gemmatimonadaceae bacterium]|nr:hypothetical protein [Gloeobacterales cyanobacterium ES-bin-141]
MNNANTSPEHDEGFPQWLAQTPEGLRKQVLIYHAMAGRRSDLLDELGNLFDELCPIIEQAAPGWWEAHDPLAKIEDELDGWRPARVAGAKRAAGLIHRGPISEDQREELKRRTTEAGLRGKSQD